MGSNPGADTWVSALVMIGLVEKLALQLHCIILALLLLIIQLPGLSRSQTLLPHLHQLHDNQVNDIGVAIPPPLGLVSLSTQQRYGEPYYFASRARGLLVFGLGWILDCPMLFLRSTLVLITWGCTEIWGPIPYDTGGNL